MKWETLYPRPPDLCNPVLRYFQLGDRNRRNAAVGLRIHVRTHGLLPQPGRTSRPLMPTDQVRPSEDTSVPITLRRQDSGDFLVGVRYCFVFALMPAPGLPTVCGFSSSVRVSDVASRCRIWDVNVRAESGSENITASPPQPAVPVCQISLFLFFKVATSTDLSASCVFILVCRTVHVAGFADPLGRPSHTPAVSRCVSQRLGAAR